MSNLPTTALFPHRPATCVTGETSTTRYILVRFNLDAISSGSVMSVRREIEDLVTESPDSVEVDVWLESPGGDANAAFKLALLLRHISRKVRVVIPDIAKSAATLLALSGHEIYMAPAAELGPLDAQLFDEGSVHRYTSALNIARAADEVARDAVTLGWYWWCRVAQSHWPESSSDS